MKGDYKEPIDAIAALKSGDAKGVEPALRFLSVDYYGPRSGYVKEYLWRYLQRVKMNERQKERVQRIALKCLNHKIRREFRPMCRLMAQIFDENFEAQVNDLITAAPDEGVQRRAKLLKEYLYDKSINGAEGKPNCCGNKMKGKLRHVGGGA